MQFVVPQFIDVEDKVIGPISVRQFILMLSGAALIYIEYELIYHLNNNIWVFLIAAIFTVLADIVFAFVKVNGRPFHFFLLNFLVTMREPRLRIWSKEVSLKDLKREQLNANPVQTVIEPAKKSLTPSKLAMLSLVVDTGGAFKAPAKIREGSVRVEGKEDPPLPEDEFRS